MRAEAPTAADKTQESLAIRNLRSLIWINPAMLDLRAAHLSVNVFLTCDPALAEPAVVDDVLRQ